MIDASFWVLVLDQRDFDLTFLCCELLNFLGTKVYLEPQPKYINIL